MRVQRHAGLAGAAGAVGMAVSLLLAGPGPAHETGQAAESATEAGAEVRLSVSIDTAAAAPPLVTVPRGAHVRLTVIGGGGAELHLHGYDVEAGGDPAVLEFDATHEGRFPVETHVEDELLGRQGKPVLFVEVRAP